MTLYLARHGETEWNRDRRMQGLRGGPLTERGCTQARALAVAAGALGVERILASPLERALTTATVVAETLGLPVVTCPEVVEMDFGECTGLTELEIAAKFPSLASERAWDKWHHAWPGGESYADVVTRLERLVASGTLARSERTLVVAHQATNRALVHLLANESTEDVLVMAQTTDTLLRLDGSGSAYAPLDDLVFRIGLNMGKMTRLF